MKFEDKIEKLISISGSKNRYQYFLLIIVFFLWSNCNFMAVVLPYLERKPMVEYTEGGKTYKKLLDNEICKKKYNVTEHIEYSWVQQFNIMCDSKKTGLISSFTFLGETSGGILFGLITKFIPYKKNMVISSILFSVVIFSLTFVNSISLFPLLLFGVCFTSLFCNFLCYSSLSNVEEVVSMEKRTLFGSIVNLGYAFSGLMFTLIFYLQRNWVTNFYILIGFMVFWLILIAIFVKESPRYYIEKRDVPETLKVLKQIAKFNGKEEQYETSLKKPEIKMILDEIENSETSKEENRYEIKEDEEEEENKEIKEENMENNRQSDVQIIPDRSTTTEELLDEEQKVAKAKSAPKPKKQKIGALSLIKYASIRYTFLLLCFLRFSCCGIYNGVSVDSKNLSGNFYINQVILFITEAISYTISGFLIEIKYLGRKGTMLCCFVIMVISLFISAFIELGATLQFLFNLLPRFCSSAIRTILSIYSLELYPTPVRAIGIGINAGIGNVGGILFPYIQEVLNIRIYNSIYAGLSVLCGISLIYLDETRGKPIVETIKELEEISDNKDSDEDLTS